MENNNFNKIGNKYFKKNLLVKYNYKLYTPEMIEEYKVTFKRILKMTNDKARTKFIMFNKVEEWYKNEKNINISMEKIYLKSKLGSFTSGGCGIGASLLAGLTASGIFSYIDNYLKKLGPFFLTIYIVLVLCFGIKILYDEDSKVEMYNVFLEALNNLEYDKNEK
ncbi:hypothetical protein GKZ28_05750 [Clostridium chromiireducens]|uniref:Uncharacterized protein n=1 Tax=Clostridium chromiireducens TaxID=225345 RepID=A0A964W1M8_9CLOT|nr:hypothetical protein [Clostridium chromiireducens]MVX63202.1 hypothetical protein [Clostridium chromiireducens]